MNFELIDRIQDILSIPIAGIMIYYLIKIDRTTQSKANVQELNQRSNSK